MAADFASMPIWLQAVFVAVGIGAFLFGISPLFAGLIDPFDEEALHQPVEGAAAHPSDL